jgi:hypothetical protein
MMIVSAHSFLRVRETWANAGIVHAMQVLCMGRGDTGNEEVPFGQAVRTAAGITFGTGSVPFTGSA